MKDKRNVLIIAVILVIAFSLTFLLVDITTNFIEAYIFSLIGIAGLIGCTFAMFNKKGDYPWIAAIPGQALTYLVIEAVLSVAVVLLEQLHVFVLPVVWFLALQIVVLAIFVIRIVLIFGGAEHIEARGEEVKQKVRSLRLLQTDVETLASKATNEHLKKSLTGLAESIRFSDPMSAGALAPLEGVIEANVAELKLAMGNNDVSKAEALIREVSLLLEERSRKCKVLK